MFSSSKYRECGKNGEKNQENCVKLKIYLDGKINPIALLYHHVNMIES